LFCFLWSNEDCGVTCPLSSFFSICFSSLSLIERWIKNEKKKQDLEKEKKKEIFSRLVNM